MENLLESNWIGIVKQGGGEGGGGYLVFISCNIRVSLGSVDLYLTKQLKVAEPQSITRTWFTSAFSIHCLLKNNRILLFSGIISYDKYNAINYILSRLSTWIKFIFCLGLLLAEEAARV